MQVSVGRKKGRILTFSISALLLWLKYPLKSHVRPCECIMDNNASAELYSFSCSCIPGSGHISFQSEKQPATTTFNHVMPLQDV